MNKNKNPFATYRKVRSRKPPVNVLTNGNPLKKRH